MALYNPAAASVVPFLFYWQGTVWDRGKLQDVLPSSIVAQILLVPISREEPDLIRWDLTIDGTFQLRSAWELVRCTKPRIEVFSLIWQQLIPSWISFFFWQMLHGFLATDDALCLRGFCMVSRRICDQAAETACHLFLVSPRIRLVSRCIYDPSCSTPSLGTVRPFSEPSSSPPTLFYLMADLEGL